MPLIQVKAIEGIFSAEQKTEIVKKLTDAIVSVEGEALRGFTWVVIEDVPSGAWGMGGNAITTEQVRAIAAGGR